MHRSSKRLIALTLRLIGVHLDLNKTLPQWQQPTKSYKPHWKKMPKNFPIKVAAVGHTHIDVAWLWRLKHTREKSRAIILDRASFNGRLP